MTDAYEPTSDFLKAVAAEDIPLTGHETADLNLRHLIAMMRDEDRSNRDWATMLLSQQPIDTDDVRTALLIAARDEDDVVRAEAILGLAQRDRDLALPFARRELAGKSACMPLFEAAALIANPILVEVLRPWIEPSENAFLDELACEALAACERADTTTE
jgi:hypothetical protein